MATWFTADLHLGHRSIINYCDRPFESVGAMDCVLIARWNEAVSDDDTIWVLGDFALGTIADALLLAGELRGHLHLLTGNHDRCWGWTRPACGRLDDRYLEAGFAEVRHGHCNHRDRRHRGSHLPLPVQGR